MNSNLYTWRVTASHNYGPDTVVVVAPSVVAARPVAIAEVRAWLLENRDWLDADELAAELAMAEAFIAKEPKEHKTGSLFIRGSD